MSTDPSNGIKDPLEALQIYRDKDVVKKCFDTLTLIQEMNTLTKIKYSGKYGNILIEVTKQQCEMLKCLKNIELLGKT